VGYFPDTIAEALAGRMVCMAYLVRFQFVSQTMQVWNGNGRRKFGGTFWDGLRGIGNIEGLEQAVNGNAPQAIFTLSGVSLDLQTEEEGDPFDYVNQPVNVFIQFFTTDGRWTPLDSPRAVWGGTMQTFQESTAWDEGKKQWVDTIGVTAESWFAGRGRPPYSYYSNSDQALRFPGDRGLEIMSALQNYTVRWPTF
jgi:hypothetical protein